MTTKETITVLMSHSQFRRVKAYTETCMAKSLRQAYDYWQDQPGFYVMSAQARDDAVSAPHAEATVDLTSRKLAIGRKQIIGSHHGCSLQQIEQICALACATWCQIRAPQLKAQLAGQRLVQHV